MTSPEHTLVGIHLAIALRLHRYFGWQAVAMAGIASNLPDWDGLPMLIDMRRFEWGHRVWGHNLFAIILSSLALAWTQQHFHWIDRLSQRLRRFLPTTSPAVSTTFPSAPMSPPLGQGLAGRYPLMAAWLIAMLVQAIHLPCDMVVSGGNGLTDWPIQILWPLSQREFVFPLIPWGDIGPTVILMTGVILLAKKIAKESYVSIGTLALLCLYLFARGWQRGMLAG